MKQASKRAMVYFEYFGLGVSHFLKADTWLLAWENDETGEQARDCLFWILRSWCFSLPKSNHLLACLGE